MVVKRYTVFSVERSANNSRIGRKGWPAFARVKALEKRLCFRDAKATGLKLRGLSCYTPITKMPTKAITIHPTSSYYASIVMQRLFDILTECQTIGNSAIYSG
jgi:hypothetical protein